MHKKPRSGSTTSTSSWMSARLRPSRVVVDVVVSSKVGGGNNTLPLLIVVAAAAAAAADGSSTVCCSFAPRRTLEGPLPSHVGFVVRSPEEEEEEEEEKGRAREQ